MTTRWLVDTNVVSEVRKGRRCDPNVQVWWAATDPEALYTSVLVLGEVRRGIESLRRRDPASATALDAWIRHVASGFADRVLGIDDVVAEEWGRLSATATLPTVDGLLAATAKVHGLVLVTRNVKDVRRTGVAVLDPFAARAERDGDA